MSYYKFLTAENRGKYSDFGFTPYLPRDGKPGNWLPKRENIKLCERGWHGFEFKHAVNWVNAQLYEVEFRGDMITGDDKVVAAQMRFIRKVDAWNDKTARLFACRCARDVLPLFEREYPNDPRPRMAIETAEKYANGEANSVELSAARAVAWDAARAVAWDAARYAAKAAARAAAKAAAWAAWDAARYAAWDAAWDAARYAAWDAARYAAWDKYNGWLVEMLGLEQEVF